VASRVVLRETCAEGQECAHAERQGETDLQPDVARPRGAPEVVLQGSPIARVVVVAARCHSQSADAPAMYFVGWSSILV
jgi:hypothetical protein